MGIKMRPDDVLTYRRQLEPATELMTGDEKMDSNSIELASIAISLKRVADEQVKQTKIMENMMRRMGHMR
jgi:hypothetical protein